MLPGFAPAGEALLFRQKAPKPLTPRLASLKRRDARLRRADQLAPLKQGPPADESVPPEAQTAGIGPLDKPFKDSDERGAIYTVCSVFSSILFPGSRDFLNVGPGQTTGREKTRALLKDPVQKGFPFLIQKCHPPQIQST